MPTLESTRAGDCTLTGVEFEGRAEPDESFQLSCGKVLKSGSEDESSSCESVDNEAESRRILIAGGFATSQEHPYRTLTTNRTGFQGRCGVSSRSATWIVVGVVVLGFLVGTAALTAVWVSRADEIPEEPMERSTTVSPEDPNVSTPSPPPVPEGGRIKPNVRFTLALQGFICGYTDEFGNSLCVSTDRGICVRLIRRHKRLNTEITVVVDTENRSRICRNRRSFREV